MYKDPRAKRAFQWAQVYFVLEVVWFLMWIGTMISIETLISGADSESYESSNTLLAFHGFTVGAVIYYLEGGELLIMLLPIGMTLGTDLNAVIHVILHTPHTVQWGWGLLLAIPIFGIVLDVYALIWAIYCVFVEKIGFERKRSAGAAAATARRISRTHAL